MNKRERYRADALRVIGRLEQQLGEEILEGARDLVEHNEAPIGLTIAASLIVDHNLTVPMWVIDAIRRLLQAWPEQLVEVPDRLETHGSSRRS